ncbi:ABC transporter ATP-binding protein [Burkholderia sp. Ac-20365]|uniref:ABC transporter ATP-binding protein n=1 Tax=Burkholderia sp. Ac-20365 TaxID=2703897 RepID=UPI00197B5851|nr:ABC transporter ATP-binding protein [Burkholderia sp. Ac-20365]MBN3766180.1 ABC transporter ATP-binding protein [Burkholderia sp. Ac-20365]
MRNSVSVRLRGVSKSFGAVQALKPLNIDVKPGELLSLLGPSGCGKTTTLRMIAGFDVPDVGSVWFGNDDVTLVPPNRRSIGMVFQNYGLFPHMTIGENVAYGLKMRGVSRAEQRQRVGEMLETVRLGGFENRRIHQLSGGQQQRVALARALITNPSVLLLDEPLGALDKNLRERMQFELREIQRRFQITSIMVTHDQEEALTMSDRIAVMSEGQVLQVGTPTEIYASPKSQFVSEFLGAANIFSGTVKRSANAPAMEFDFAPAFDGPIPTDAEAGAGQPIRIAVRPEKMKIVGREQGLPATVLDIVFRGNYFAYELALEGVSSRTALVYSQEPLPVDRSAPVGLNWLPESAMILA